MRVATWSVYRCIIRIMFVVMGVMMIMSPVDAAEITILHRGRAATVVGIEGQLELADGEKFATLIRPLGTTIVLFNSPGGNLLAGLRIGQLIHSRQFSTLVPDDSVCASACALAWVGGTQRYLGPKSRLGFHAAYMLDGETSRVSGSANAIVGAYLDRLGLGDEAIYALTDADPDDVRWLDVAGANRLGIAVREFRVDTVTPPPVAAPPIYSARQRANAIVTAYFNAGSSDGVSALQWLTSHYAPLVDFYGKATSAQSVLKEKAAFVRRWPERIYIPIDKATATVCSLDGRICRVTGTMQYEARSYSRGAYSAGLASFAITVAIRGNRSMITEESGRVLVRR